MVARYYTLFCPLCSKVEAFDFEADKFFVLPTTYCPCSVSPVCCVWEWHGKKSDRDARARALDEMSKAMVNA